MAANLFQAYLQPVRSVADYGAEMDRADANAITLQTARQQNALQAVAAREAQADQNALQRIAAQARTSDDLVTGLRQSGRPALMMQADKIEQGALSRRKTEADIGETSAKTNAAKFDLGQKRRQVALGKVVSAGSQQGAMQALQAAFDAGELDQGEAQALYTNLQDPASFAKVIRGIQLRQLSPDAAYKAMTPDLKTVDLGGATQVVDMNADTRGGAPVTLKKTQTPDSVASVAATIRGQNLTNDRAKEAQASASQAVTYQQDADGNIVALPSRAVPGAMVRGAPVVAGPGMVPMRGADKTTEAERGAAGYGARMTEASKLLDVYEKKGRPTYTTDAAGGIPLVGNTARTAVMDQDQQLYRQAQEDWVRAKLRKESGAAIGVDEMDREIRSYFPQPGEGEEVAKQKRRARKVAEEAMGKSAGRAAYKSEVPSAVVDWSELK